MTKYLSQIDMLPFDYVRNHYILCCNLLGKFVRLTWNGVLFLFLKGNRSRKNKEDVPLQSPVHPHAILGMPGVPWSHLLLHQSRQGNGRPDCRGWMPTSVMITTEVMKQNTCLLTSNMSGQDEPQTECLLFILYFLTGWWKLLELLYGLSEDKPVIYWWMNIIKQYIQR